MLADMVALTSTEKKLAENNLELVNMVVGVAVKARKILPPESDECKSFCYESLCKAAKRYKKGKNCKFNTYATNCIRWGIYDYLRSKGTPTVKTRLLTEDIAVPSESTTSGLGALIENAKLTHKQRKIARLLMVHKTIDIAKMLKVTGSGVLWMRGEIINRLKRAVKARNLTLQDFIA